MLGMKTLLLLRHGKASGSDTDCGDFERPLTKRGKRDVPKMGCLLREQNLLPDIIIASSAKRCRQTAARVIEHSGYRGEARLLGDLYEASDRALREFLQALDDRYQRALLIAHNPGLELLLHATTASHEALTTAALAHIELPIESWHELNAETRGTLHNLWQPDELEDD
jgi:phosphohistidine phosphatase